MRNLQLIGVLLSIQCTMPNQIAFAATISAAQTATRLGDFETRFFGHTNAKYDLTDRLSRLESLVFGETFANDPVQERVDRLVNAISRSDKHRIAPATAKKLLPKSSANALASRQRSTGEENQTSTASDKQPTKISHQSYPRITQLEKRLLGTTYENESLDTRLGRLEKKEFGWASNSPDLCSRTEKLMSKACMSEEQFLQSNTAVSTDDVIDDLISMRFSRDLQTRKDLHTSDGVGMGAKLNMLEREAFGQTNPTIPFITRLELLESRIYGTTEKNKNMLERIAQLSSSLGVDKISPSLPGHSLPVDINELLSDPLASDPLAPLSGLMMSSPKSMPASNLTLQIPTTTTATAGSGSSSPSKHPIWKKIGKAALCAGELAACALGFYPDPTGYYGMPDPGLLSGTPYQSSAALAVFANPASFAGYPNAMSPSLTNSLGSLDPLSWHY